MIRTRHLEVADKIVDEYSDGNKCSCYVNNVKSTKGFDATWKNLSEGKEVKLTEEKINVD